MVEEISRRAGLKLLAAMSGGAVAAATVDDDTPGGGLLPVGGGGGPDPVPASSYDPTVYTTGSRPVDETSVITPALVIVKNGSVGIVEVTG